MRRDVLAAVMSTIVLLAGCAGTVHAPYPPIRADSSPQALTRGAAIFHASCEACHRGGGRDTASGAPLRELPSYMGRFHSANLTSDPVGGIGAAKDEELARAIRYAVSRDGRLMVMPSYGMGDADLAAVLGFLRSEDPLFRADPKPAPACEFSFVGGIGFRFVTGNTPAERPASGIPVPPKGPTLEYGRYMAHEVYDCASCHTDGFSPDKTKGDEAFSGGMAFVDPEGRKVYSSNLTFDATGLANWTLADFTRALRDGLAPDGSALRSPMPRFRALDEAEARALYDYLRTLAPRKNAVDGARPRLTATSARAAWVNPDTGAGEQTAETQLDTAAEAAVAEALPPAATPTATPAVGSTPTPSTTLASGQVSPVVRKPRPVLTPAKVDAAKLFVQYGCSSCHAPGARYHDRLAHAAHRPDLELVKWVRNPEKYLPGTPMPTYAELIDERTALALVRWVKAGGPSTLATPR
ncbi:cytochrome c [Corallococcus sp. H22C18031201]|nr:cytochrome c [Corallococcus sp. H22C18031201]